MGSRHGSGNELRASCGGSVLKNSSNPKDDFTNYDPSVEEFKASFAESKRAEVLVYYDFTRVFTATDKLGRLWLFKWCDRIRERNEIDVWLAFQITSSQFVSMKEGITSLREAISLAKGNLYLLSGDDPFNPESVEIQEFDNLSSSYLPRNDVSFKDGCVMRVSKRLDAQLGIRLHVWAEAGQPLSYVSFPKRFQEFLSATAHNLEGTALYPNYPVDDWSVLQITRLSSGSLDLDCVGKTVEKARALSDACELLASLLRPESDVGHIQTEMGNDGFALAVSLLKTVQSLDLSVSIRWTMGDLDSNYLSINKKRAERTLTPRGIRDFGRESYRSVQRIAESSSIPMDKSVPFRRVIMELAEDELEPIKLITLTLTDDEAEPIRRAANGTGGMQSLLRELSTQLGPDNTVSLSFSQIEKVIRYTSNYGVGGFQGRLRGLARALKRIGISLSEF